MKKFFTVLSIALCTTIFISCNGKTAKETERFVTRLYKEYKAMSESDAYRYYNMQRKIDKFEQLSHNISKCSTCLGYGVVYKTDENGNYYGQFDGYGNFCPTIFTCPACYGSGKK